MKKILDMIERVKAAGTLTDWEKSFITSLSERAEKYGEALNVSDKQKATIAKIFEERVGGSRPPKKTGSSFPVSDELPA